VLHNNDLRLLQALACSDRNFFLPCVHAYARVIFSVLCIRTHARKKNISPTAT